MIAAGSGAASAVARQQFGIGHKSELNFCKEDFTR
jgi:hypothetical protein